MAIVPARHSPGLLRRMPVGGLIGILCMGVMEKIRATKTFAETTDHGANMRLRQGRCLCQAHGAPAGPCFEE